MTNEEKVNEFLREISPMREAAFWHDFIGRCFLPENGTQDGIVNWQESKPRLRRHEINANINNNVHSLTTSKKTKLTPPPLPPKPKLFKPVQPARQTSSWAPSIVITPIRIDSRGNHRRSEHHPTSAFVKMGAINDGSKTQNGTSVNAVSSSSALLNGDNGGQSTNSEKSIASDMATLGTVDSNNNNQENVPVNGNETSENVEKVSFEKKKEMFQSKSSSPNLCRTESESRLPPLSPHFQRCNSVPGTYSSSENNQQMSPRQPHFASSSFYDPREHPTIEEQVSLCREIAKQLVSDVINAKSKGREMFERRVEKSSKWVTENEDSFQNFSSVEEDYHERTISEGPPNLRLLLDPRHVEDINTVQGVNEHIIVSQEAQTRDTCRHIVQDLTSPEVNPNRGNTLFAKRVQKSITDGWIVDDVAEQVIDAARDKLFRNLKGHHSASSSPIPSMSPYSRYSSPIAGPVFTPVASSLPPSRPASAMSFMFKDFNSRPKPFCRAF